MSLQLCGFQDVSYQKHFIPGCFLADTSANIENQDIFSIRVAHTGYECKSVPTVRPGRPTFSIIVGQGPIALAVGAGGGCLDIFTLLYPFSTLSPSLWETARYRPKYWLKGPLNPKQSINQSTYG